MASLCPEDSNKVVYMCPTKQNTHKDSRLLDPTYMTSLSFLIFLMMIKNLGVTSKWLPYVPRIPKWYKKCLQGDIKNWSPLKCVGKVCWLRQNCRKKWKFSTGGGRGYKCIFLEFFWLLCLSYTPKNTFSPVVSMFLKKVYLSPYANDE